MSFNEQIPGKPHEPDVAGVTRNVVELLVSHGKVLSPIGARPATIEDWVAWGIEQGAEMVLRCSVHGSDYDGVVKGGRIVAGQPGCEVWMVARLNDKNPKLCDVRPYLLYGPIPESVQPTGDTK